LQQGFDIDAQEQAVHRIETALPLPGSACCRPAARRPARLIETGPPVFAADARAHEVGRRGCR
jgi:hypothetical protein